MSENSNKVEYEYLPVDHTYQIKDLIGKTVRVSKSGIRATGPHLYSNQDYIVIDTVATNDYEVIIQRSTGFKHIVYYGYLLVKTEKLKLPKAPTQETKVAFSEYTIMFINHIKEIEMSEQTKSETTSVPNKHIHADVMTKYYNNMDLVVEYKHPRNKTG
jgi:hypothetical protein